jgi:hypothetical protein
LTVEDARAILEETGTEFPTLVLERMVALGLARGKKGVFSRKR